MLFAEVLAPAGVLSRQQRDHIGQRFVSEVTCQGEQAGAPGEVLERAGSLYHVLFRDVEDWYVAGHRTESVPLLVRVTVPENWREELSEFLITAFTKILTETVDENLAEKPNAWIHVIGVPDGGMGVFGNAMTAKDFVRYITKPVRGAPAPADLPAGTGYDPVCGMTVPYQHAAAVAEHDGTTYAFCSSGCHEVFLEENPAAEHPAVS